MAVFFTPLLSSLNVFCFITLYSHNNMPTMNESVAYPKDKSEIMEWWLEAGEWGCIRKRIDLSSQVFPDPIRKLLNH